MTGIAHVWLVVISVGCKILKLGPVSLLYEYGPINLIVKVLFSQEIIKVKNLIASFSSIKFL